MRKRIAPVTLLGTPARALQAGMAAQPLEQHRPHGGRQRRHLVGGHDARRCVGGYGVLPL